MNKLKQCPFCNGDAYEGDYTHENGGDWYFVKCDMCCARSDEYHAQEVANIEWNSRPIEEALRAEIEQLKAENAELKLIDEAVTGRVKELAMDLLVEKARTMRLKDDIARMHEAIDNVLRGFPSLNTETFLDISRRMERTLKHALKGDE